MKDICCIGHITRDRIITPRQTVYMSGGTSFYFAYAFSHLPKEVSFQLVTKVGSDSMQAISDMQRAGIDVVVLYHCRVRQIETVIPAALIREMHG